MIRRVFPSMLALLASPAFAQADEIDPVPAHALIGHGYFTESTPSQILFINVRARPVRILWVGFDGSEHLYDELAEGQQLLQPTFVGHRWLIRDSISGEPLEGFISTPAAARSTGTPQIALIR